MTNQVLTMVHGGLTLLRSIAVVSSSVATIISSLLPLVLYHSIPNGFMYFIFLVIPAFMIHGVLTHAFNDYTDHLSGTDAYSPAMLSGGSRVIQTGVMPVHIVWLLGKWLAIVLFIIAILLVFLSQYKLAILLFVGIWAAASYSLSPLRLSYRPFLGEWLCLFPALLFLGFAGPWIALGFIPLWALQNAVINALFCMAWVMVHHIPDLEADRQAVPKKQTSVVWFADLFGLYFARFPALIYFVVIGLCAFWLGADRIWAAISLIILVLIAVFLVMKMNVADHEQVTSYEKILLLLAVITAVSLGVFI